MPITKADVLEVLGDLRLRNIRFSVGAININSDEYDRVADLITAGAISVEPSSKSFSRYVPEKNTLRTMEGNPPLRLSQRTNLLHECTHVIPDIHKLKLARLTDEAAAYLAETAYLLILDPAADEPPLGLPLNNMTRQCMQLVRKYQLGKSAGRGVTIGQSDISSLAEAVQRIPDYGHIGDKDMLATDGVALGGKADEFYRLQLSRFVNQQLDETIRRHTQELMTVKVRYAAHENYVTWDPELLSLFDRYTRGPEAQKQAAQKKLLHIFLTVTQVSATDLFRRLSVLRRGDAASERFQRGFPVPVKSGLLAALQFAR